MQAEKINSRLIPAPPWWAAYIGSPPRDDRGKKGYPYSRSVFNAGAQALIRFLGWLNPNS